MGLLRELLGDGGVLMVGTKHGNNSSVIVDDDHYLNSDINDITALDVIITI